MTINAGPGSADTAPRPHSAAAGTGTLVRYDAMISAIIECHRVDEVKDLRDKAMALEMYARQAKNTEAERKASEIRLRAERRTGELLKELARTPNKESGQAGGKGLPTVGSPSPYAEALQKSGISTQSASRYQELASIPAPVFEEALRDPERKPTTTRIIAEARDPMPKMADDALALRAYYSQSRDVDNEVAAMRIRLRAERRLGELIAAEQEAGRLATQARHGKGIQASVDSDDTRTLADLGIPRDRSARAQELARVPEEQFEAGAHRRTSAALRANE